MNHKCKCGNTVELTEWGSNYMADCPNCGKYVVTPLEYLHSETPVDYTAEMAESYIKERKRGVPATRS